MRRALAVIALMVGAPALAADLTVPGDHPTIAQAVAAAVDGDVIWIDAGTWDEGVSYSGKGLSFRPSGGLVTWSAPSGLQVIEVIGGGLTVEGLILDGSFARRSIRAVDSAVTVVDSAIVNGQASDGGGISQVNGTLAVGNTYVGSNASVGRGGAIALWGTAQATVTDATVELNYSSADNGGAIAVNDLTGVDVVGSTFQNNWAWNNGGAIYSDEDVSIATTTFSGNIGNRGGAIHCYYSNLCTVTDSTFRGNIALDDGGALALQYPATVAIDRSLFCDNTTFDPVSFTTYGSAWLLWGTPLTHRNNVYAGGEAERGQTAVLAGAITRSENNTYVSGQNLENGAALYSVGSPTAVNDLYAFHSTPYGGYAVYDSTGLLAPTWSQFYGNYWADANVALGTGSATGNDPMLANWPGGACEWTDFVPLAGSPLIDAGDPALLDPDGSPSDVGALGGPNAPLEYVTDGDGDGWVAFEDCDDADASISPDAVEVCDALDVDEDCDGLADNLDPGVTGVEPTWPDADLDGYGDAAAAPVDLCPDADNVTNDLDCDDLDPAVYLGQDWYEDVDGDGFGDAASTMNSCGQPPGFVADDTDCDDTDPAVGGPSPWYTDGDGDGYGPEPGTPSCVQPPYTVALGGDCDDADPTLSPAAPEACDGIDNDCDGRLDDADPDIVDAVPTWPDADGDGFGDAKQTPTDRCLGPGLADNGDDCNDGDPAVTLGPVWYGDGDGDGFGDPTVSVQDCTAPAGYVDNLDDCDDADPLTGGPSQWFPDADFDGYGNAFLDAWACAAPPGYLATGGDCDDADPAISPGAPEVCDDLDNDCDGLVDAADPGLDPTTFRTWYFDGDGDGFGVGAPVLACSQPPGASASGLDCDDTDPAVNPDAVEVCNGIDDDCTGLVDDDAFDAPRWYDDADGDGYGVGQGTQACQQPPLTAFLDGDCDDTEIQVNPGVAEVCDGLDNDCDGHVDIDAIDGVQLFQDIDGDGHGDPYADAPVLCGSPAGYSALADDCNDRRADAYPGAPEVCNGWDDDCDDLADEGLPTFDWYPDEDGDGFGASGSEGQVDCAQPDGFVEGAEDCDDADPMVFPGAPELADNGVDEDCDGDDLSGGSERTPEPPEPPVSAGPVSVGCGCDTGPGPMHVGWALLGLALVVRRRSGRR